MGMDEQGPAVGRPHRARHINQFGCDCTEADSAGAVIRIPPGEWSET
jgi:hypothetical protein